MAPVTDGPIDPQRASPQLQPRAHPQSGGLHRGGGGAEPGRTQDAQPIIKLVTPENAAYLFAKSDIASPGPSAMGRIR